eukprot:TRINITY_DN605_c0_g1_i2.p1 TRINITY_DN605_c0_g1~~TRINITY_DN605_c0_g1_i2.p1  ORF type:complete len:778 (+),score=175.47 TRINITY_DN605_c0_g1_i2:78-2411(+)
MSDDGDDDKLDLTNENPLVVVLSIVKHISTTVSIQNEEVPDHIKGLQSGLQVLAALCEKLKQLIGDDFPKELLEITSDISADLEEFQDKVGEWAQRHGKSNAILRFVPLLKPFADSMGPAAALYLAMMPNGTIYIFLLVIFLFSFFYLRPEMARDVAEAWKNDDLEKFKEMRGKIEEHIKSLRSFMELETQLRSARRFDVTRALEGVEMDVSCKIAAKNFWIDNFGAENHSVPTPRFIETLLSSFGGHLTLKEKHRQVVYTIIRKIVDVNNDGSVSPNEFLRFLQLFGPLDLCIARVKDSLLDFSVDPPVQFPWFSWQQMSRDDTNAILPSQGPGTFLIRCASDPGKFAVSFVRDDLSVSHGRIVNSLHPQHLGYYIEFTQHEEYFPSLYDLVKCYPEHFRRSYIDHSQRVTFNVSGRVFETTTGLFLKHPDSLLGRMFVAGHRLDDGPIFLDRDPDIFSIILNWYRYESVFCPPHVCRLLLLQEASYYGLPPSAVEQIQMLHRTGSSSSLALSQQLMMPPTMKRSLSASSHSSSHSPSHSSAASSAYLTDLSSSNSAAPLYRVVSAAPASPSLLHSQSTLEPDTLGQPLHTSDNSGGSAYGCMSSASMADGSLNPVMKQVADQLVANMNTSLTRQDSPQIVRQPTSYEAPPDMTLSTAAPSSESCVRDLSLESKEFFCGLIRRDEVSRLLSSLSPGHFLVRYCNDPAELKNGSYDPDVFVISFYSEDSNLRNVKIYRGPEGFCLHKDFSSQSFVNLDELFSTCSELFLSTMIPLRR